MTIGTVDPEDRPPPDEFDEDTADERAQPDAEAGHAAPTPIAGARSRGSVKTLVMIDIATGLSIEPPSACSIRKAISHPTEGARLDD